MLIEKIGNIKSNPDNPRLIKDERFKKLVKSIKEFPEMLHLRPIVVNDEMVVLGGNMRLKACKEAGLTEVPVIKASSLTPDQQREFIIKDNLGFGEWDWELIANEWDAEQLGEWGLDIPNWSLGHEINNMTEEDLDFSEEFDPIGSASSLHKIIFIFDDPEQGGDFMKDRLPDIEFKKTCGPAGSIWQVNLSTVYGK